MRRRSFPIGLATCCICPVLKSPSRSDCSHAGYTSRIPCRRSFTVCRHPPAIVSEFADWAKRRRSMGKRPAARRNFCCHSVTACFASRAPVEPVNSSGARHYRCDDDLGPAVLLKGRRKGLTRTAQSQSLGPSKIKPLEDRIHKHSSDTIFCAALCRPQPGRGSSITALSLSDYRAMASNGV